VGFVDVVLCGVCVGWGVLLLLRLMRRFLNIEDRGVWGEGFGGKVRGGVRGDGFGGKEEIGGKVRGEGGWGQGRGRESRGGGGGEGVVPN
jgi:hypothetical protein